MNKIKDYIHRGLHYIIKGQPQITTTAVVCNFSPNDMLADKCALITGGTSGIGFCIAQAFINAGAKVIITGRTQKKIDDACLKLGDSSRGIVFDITDTESIDSKFQQILLLLPELQKDCIDILVNNAGVNSTSMPHADPKEFDKVISTNLKGPFFLSELFGKYLIKNHTNGNILNIASASSLRPGNSAYILSKWGMRSLTIGLAKSLAPYGITVNGLAPGPTVTPMITKGAEIDNIAVEGIPIGRYALPEEIASMAVILVSNLGKTIVGDIIYMTGGSGVTTVDNADYSFNK